MWYSDENIKIDYSKPIIAENPDGEKQILMPQINGSYTTTHYNWFYISSGAYASYVNFSTPMKAVESRAGYDVYNADIVINKI